MPVAVQTVRPNIRVLLVDQTDEWSLGMTAQTGRICGVYVYDANQKVVVNDRLSYHLHFVESQFELQRKLGLTDEEEQEMLRFQEAVLASCGDTPPETHMPCNEVDAFAAEDLLDRSEFPNDEMLGYTLFGPDQWGDEDSDEAIKQALELARAGGV